MTLVLTNMCIWPKHVLTNVFTNICSMHWKIFAHQDVHGKDAFSNSLHTWAVMVWAIQYLNLSQVRGLKTLTGKGIGTGDRNQTQINFVSPSALSIFPVHPARCEGTIGNMKTHFRVSWIEFTLQYMNSHFQFSICIFGKRHTSRYKYFLVLTCRQALICRWYWQTHRWPPVSVESKTPRFQKSRANYEPGQIIWLRCCVVIELKHWQKNSKREYFGCIGGRQDSFTNGSIKDNENLPSLQNSKRYKYYHVVSESVCDKTTWIWGHKVFIDDTKNNVQLITWKKYLESGSPSSPSCPNASVFVTHLVVCYEQLWVDVDQLTDRHSLWKLSQLI